MDADDDNIYMTSIQDWYAARASNLDYMCLTKFATNYDTTSGKSLSAKNSDNLLESDGDDGEDGENDAKTSRYKSSIQGFGNNEKEKTWYNSGQKLQTHNRAREILPLKANAILVMAFRRWYSGPSWDLQRPPQGSSHYCWWNTMSFNQFHSDIDIAMNNLAENGPPEIAWDSIVQGIEEDNVKSINAPYAMNQQIDEDEDVTSDLVSSTVNDAKDSTQEIECNDLGTLYAWEAQKNHMSQDTYNEHVCILNADQRKIVMFNCSWCKGAVSAARDQKILPDYKIFLSGPVGTDKSHIIKLLCHDTMYFFEQTLKPNPDEPLVLITAPTGAAAFQARGCTIHSAFMLTLGERKTIGLEKRSTMEIKLQKMVLFIIDEIGMVGFHALEKVIDVLSTIKSLIQMSLAVSAFWLWETCCSWHQLLNPECTVNHKTHKSQKIWHQYWGMISKYMN